MMDFEQFYFRKRGKGRLLEQGRLLGLIRSMVINNRKKQQLKLEYLNTVDSSYLDFGYLE